MKGKMYREDFYGENDLLPEPEDETLDKANQVEFNFK